MLWSKTFIPTLKEVPQEAESVSHQLMLRAGLVRMLMGGVYSYLPVGLAALERVQAIIREEMNAAGAAELLLPALQPLELWTRSGRDTVLGEVMIRFTDRRGRKMCLGPTHEEVITELVRSHVSSYKQMPLVLYQIQTKFRDEIRPRFGIVRACEFIMKDAYSFDTDIEGLQKNYQALYEAYNRIFTRCGLKVVAVEADSGVMGGKVSHEFLVPAESGEDFVTVDGKKVAAIELGHIFQLGTKYSETLGATFLDAKGVSNPIIMGCYGIGVSRLVAAAIEQNHDANGIIWPKELSPYQVAVMPLNTEEPRIMEKARQLYAALQDNGIRVILDDRSERAGVKFKDADLLGFTLQAIIGGDFLKNDTVELKIRRTNEKTIVPAPQALEKIKGLLNG